MNEQPVSVSNVSWRELFPWTIIFRTLPIAMGITVLAWALVGVVVTPIGWLVSENLFLQAESRTGSGPVAQIVQLNHSPYRSVFMAENNPADGLQIFGAQVSGPKLVFDQMVRPFSMLFEQGLSMREFLYFLFGSLWTLLTWCFAGCAISRVAVLRLTRGEPVDLDDAFEFARDNFRGCLLAITMPLLAVAALVIPLALFGLILGFDLGVVIGGLLWIAVLAVSTAIVILLVGLMFGWPLMIASVSAEGQNSFDAMTRSYAYTFQRPVHYLFYMLVSILFGGFCWLVIVMMTSGVINIGFWATSWGANLFDHERIEVIQGAIIPDATGVADGETTMLDRGQQIIGFWNSVLRTVASAFLYGLFWCMASAVYLLLRKDVDDTEMDEVHIREEQRTYDLPPLKSDEQGIPQVQTPEVVAEPDQAETDQD